MWFLSCTADVLISSAAGTDTDEGQKSCVWTFHSATTPSWLEARNSSSPFEGKPGYPNRFIIAFENVFGKGDCGEGDSRTGHFPTDVPRENPNYSKRPTRADRVRQMCAWSKCCSASWMCRRVQIAQRSYHGDVLRWCGVEGVSGSYTKEPQPH